MSLSASPSSSVLGHNYRTMQRSLSATAELLVLDRLLGATSKKRSSTFGGKSAPRQNPGYAYVSPSPTSELINDIVNVSKLIDLIMFADDTNIFFTDITLTGLENKANEELNKISIWFKLNKLSLNINKTNFILFLSLIHI